MKKLRVSRGIVLCVSISLLLTSLVVLGLQMFRSAKKTEADVTQLQLGGSNATNTFTGNLILPGNSKWSSDGKLSVGTGATVANSNLNVSGGAAFGSGNALIDSNGKIAAINSTNFANLSGANLTSLNANNISSGTVPVARGGTGAADAATARSNLGVPSTTGSGASGTWGIGISGNAATVTNGVYTNSAQDLTGKKVFVGDANTAQNDSTATLEIRSSGAPAVGISFHRPGIFASKLVLDSDNVFHFGGWSNGVNGATVQAATFIGALTGTATSATNISGVWGLYTNNRPRMYDIGCSGSWGSSCDGNSSGWPDYADDANSVDGQHFAWSNSNNAPTYFWSADSNGSAYLAYRPAVTVGAATTAYTWYPPVNAWQNSQDGYNRIYFGNATTTYFKSPGDFVWRNNSNADRMFLSNSDGTFRVYGTCYDGWSTPCATDIAEYYFADEPIEKADIVSINDYKKLKKSSRPYDPDIIGMRSTRPAIAINDEKIAFGQNNGANGDAINTDTKPLVALAGRVPVKIASFNGNIELGDIITSSYLPGVAMKATKAGATVGKTVEAFNFKYSDSTCRAVPSYSEIKWSSAMEEYHECYKVPTSSLPTEIQQNLRKDGFTGDSFYVGKLMTFVNVSWYDPDVYLTSTGDLNVTVDAAGKAEVKTKDGSLISRAGAFAELIVGKLRVGILEVKKLVVNGVDVLDKLNKLSATVEQQQKTIDALKKEVETLKK